MRRATTFMNSSVLGIDEEITSKWDLIEAVKDKLPEIERVINGEYDYHIHDITNPHEVTKAQVGLDSVDNTADASKEVLTATKWKTARNITASGDVAGTVNVDGSADVNIPLALAAVGDSGTGTFKKITVDAKGRIIGTQAVTQTDVTGLLGNGSITNEMLANGAVAVGKITGLATGVSTFLSTPTSANLASMLTDETGSGANVFATSPTLVTPNIGVATGTSFNSITGLSSTTPLVAGTAAVGTGVTVARADHVHPLQTTVSGNAGTATTLATSRNISMTGDLTWTTSFNGSADVTGVGTLAASGVTAGTYKSVTVDSKGRVTAGTNPTTLAGYGISDAYTKTEIDSANMLRADKYLAAQNIANMVYTNGDLTKIQYNNATDVNYELFNYTNGILTSINHYTSGVLRGTTTLSYTGGNLVSAIYA